VTLSSRIIWVVIASDSEAIQAKAAAIPSLDRFALLAMTIGIAPI